MSRSFVRPPDRNIRADNDDTPPALSRVPSACRTAIEGIRTGIMRMTTIGRKRTMENPDRTVGPEILVLDGEHPNALSVVQSLGRAGYRVSLAGTSFTGAAFMSRYPSRMLLYPDPLLDKAAFLDWILRDPSKGRSGSLFPVTDKTIHPLMDLKCQGRLPQPTFLPDPVPFPKIFNRERTTNIARECGIPLPSTVVLSSPDDLPLADRLSYPCFAKPVLAKVWKGPSGYDLSATLVRNPDELADWVTRTTRFCPVLVQEYVPGVGVGIEVLCDRGEVLCAFADKRVHELPLSGGRSCYRVSIPMPRALRENARKLLGRIGWHGLARLEFKCDGFRFWLVEVYGRVWGSMPLAISAGMDFPRWYADLLLRNSHPPSGLSPRIGLYQRKLLRDMVWFRDNYRADKTDDNLHTRPILTSALEGLRLLWGRERWDSFCVSDPRPCLHELRGIGKVLLAQIRARTFDRKERRRSRKVLRDRHPQKILVLCYGNICRSPYAAHRLKELLPGGSFEIRSAGFFPEPDREPPRSYLALVAERGIDLTAHRSSLVDTALADWADVIVIMDRINWRQVDSLNGPYTEKTVWLGAWGHEEAGLEIEDPYGKPSGKVQEILERLDGACRDFAVATGTPS